MEPTVHYRQLGTTSTLGKQARQKLTLNMFKDPIHIAH